MPLVVIVRGGETRLMGAGRGTRRLGLLLQQLQCLLHGSFELRIAPGHRPRPA